jgi:hypothetical protein
MQTLGICKQTDSTILSSCPSYTIFKKPALIILPECPRYSHAMQNKQINKDLGGNNAPSAGRIVSHQDLKMFRIGDESQTHAISISIVSCDAAC